MKIDCVGSGSKGNAYLISDGHSTLLLECGVRFKKIQEACRYETSKIQACLITHEHKDHCLCVKDILKRGIEVVATKGTYVGMGYDHHEIYTTIVKTNTKPIKISTFEIASFDTQHDANEPCGFLIHSCKTNETLLYLTDSYYCKYKFNNLTDIMIECNYDDETFLNSNDSISLQKRVMKSHMSLENCIEFLKANDISSVETIHLIHLSDRNSNEKRMYEKVAKATGKRIVVF